jgi:hypothetical protein
MSKEEFMTQYIFAALRGEWYRKWTRDAPVRFLVEDAELAYNAMQTRLGETL